MIEFKAWPKTPRLNRGMVITEKIDGTNAAVHIARRTDGLRFPGLYFNLEYATTVEVDGEHYAVGAQSRKRLITPQDDNYGFARWVWENAEGLVRALGEGTHYGEWWGSGIQRGYGLQKGEKRFSLFNVNRYADLARRVPGLGVVPEIYRGPFNTAEVDYRLECLRQAGSFAAPGFMRPEGIIVFHEAAGQVFKVTCEGDEGLLLRRSPPLLMARTRIRSPGYSPDCAARPRRFVPAVLPVRL